jgi:hypothetical protein
MRQLWCTAILTAGLGMSLISAIVPTPAHACAVCGGAADDGYFWGVLFLMSMPFVIGSFVGGWLWYGHRRAQVDPGISTPPHPVEPRMPRPDSTSLRPPIPPAPSMREDSGGSEIAALGP